MCGIAGFVDRTTSPSEELLQKQLDLLMHRGPDSSGTFVRDHAAIGQTRLAIIDLITGDPPISTENEDVGVAFNGEIYNFSDLRKELLGRGHSLSTEGDAEVIAHLSEDLEPADVARKLDGMFAYAVWDSRHARLTLARDRVGKKPLYYWHGDGKLVFASEIKALLAHPLVPRRLNELALPLYLAFGYVPSPMTFFEGIKSLPPGHVAVLEADGRLETEPYWRIPLREKDAHSGLSMDEAAACVRSSLRYAVKKRLISDVPLGAFLSGGVDSSSVVALMSEVATETVKTFSIGFDDTEGFDERPYARLVAERFGTDHTEFVVSPNAVELVEKLVWHYDEPFGDSSAIPTYLLSELTRSHVTVALSGDGGDELFAGYERFGAAVALARYRRLPSALRRLVEAGARRLPDQGQTAKVKRFFGRASLEPLVAYAEWISYVPGDRRSALLDGNADGVMQTYGNVWSESRGSAMLDRLQHLNIRTYLLDDLLPKVDRMSMAHGLEVRCPFLDHELIDVAFSLRPQLRAKGMSLKRVLKKAVGDLLPHEILHRPKHGFGIPLDRWLRTDLGEHVEKVLGVPDARVKAHLDPATVDDVIVHHRDRDRQEGHVLWTLLTLETFLQKQGW